MTKGRIGSLILVVGLGLASTLWLVFHSSKGDSPKGNSLNGGAGVQTSDPASTSPGQAALEAAARENKYMFMLFWKEDDSATQTLRQTLDAALARRVEKTTVTQVHVSDPAESPLIDRLGLNRSPMPLVLAFAPERRYHRRLSAEADRTGRGQRLCKPGYG